MELRKEYAGLLSDGSLYIFRTGVFLPPNTSYGQQVGVRGNKKGRERKNWPFCPKTSRDKSFH